MTKSARADSTEVLIVGGGPAGSTLARVLTQAGMRVVVLDKAVFPRDKICAGWVTPAVMEELELDLEDYAGDNVLQPIHGFRTGRLGQKLVQSEFPGQPASYGIRRKEFDHYLLKRCGAELMLGQGFKSMQRDGDGWLVNGSIRAELVVGAGGHFCPVARAIGAKGPRETAVAAQEIEFEMTARQQTDCPVSAELPELFFTPDLKGYGWVFRKGGFLNVGLGREDKHKLAGHVERFCNYLKQTGRIPMDTPGKLKGHAYLLYPHCRDPVVNDGVLLIGDAAGLAYAQSGEGIRPAVESALLAASSIIDCQGDYSTGRLQSYVDKLEERFGPRNTQAVRGGSSSPRLKQYLAGMLLKNNWFSKNLLIKRWFLHEQDKPLSAPDTQRS